VAAITEKIEALLQRVISTEHLTAWHLVVAVLARPLLFVPSQGRGTSPAPPSRRRVYVNVRMPQNVAHAYPVLSWIRTKSGRWLRSWLLAMAQMLKRKPVSVRRAAFGGSKSIGLNGGYRSLPESPAPMRRRPGVKRSRLRESGTQ
jgi:hypothetical protein